MTLEVLLHAAVCATFAWAAVRVLLPTHLERPGADEARRKAYATMLQSHETDELFAHLEAGRLADPDRALKMTGEGIINAVRTKEWGVASLLSLAAVRIDLGKPVDLAQISNDLTRLMKQWER